MILIQLFLTRYFATLHPLSIGNTWFRSHCHLVLLVGWLFGSIFSSIIIEHTKAVSFDYKNETMYDCRHDVNWDEHQLKIYIGVSVVFTFLLPMILISISYGAIGKKLLNCPFVRNRSTGNNSFEKRNSEFINKIRVKKSQLILFNFNLTLHFLGIQNVSCCSDSFCHLLVANESIHVVNGILAFDD